MRIVQLANYVTAGSGGQRRALIEMGTRYAAAGHEVTLVVPSGCTDPTAWPAAGVAVVEVPSVRVPRSGGYRAIVRRAPLRQALIGLRPDVVELADKTTLSWVPGWLRARSVPTVLVAHERHDSMLATSLPSWLPWRRVVRRMASRTAAASAAVVCASSFCARQFHPAVPVRRVALGVDLDLFRPACGPPAARGQLVFVGRLSPEKDPLTAVAVVRDLVRAGHDVRLVVVGDGPLREQVARAAQDLPIELLGHVADRTVVRDALAASNVLLAPCATETFGLAVLESLACGTPAVVPRGGAARELLVAGTGVIADAEPNMVRAVGALLAGDRRVQRERCRAHAMQYGWDASVAAMLDVFADVIGAVTTPGHGPLDPSTAPPPERAPSLRPGTERAGAPRP